MIFGGVRILFDMHVTFVIGLSPVHEEYPVQRDSAGCNRYQPPLFDTQDPRHRITFLRRVCHIRCSRCVRALPNTAVWQKPRFLAALEPPHGDPPVSEPSISKGQRHFSLVIAGISMSFPMATWPRIACPGRCRSWESVSRCFWNVKVWETYVPWRVNLRQV